MDAFGFVCKKSLSNLRSKTMCPRCLRLGLYRKGYLHFELIFIHVVNFELKFFFLL
jgi:hypothetical protein